MVKKCQKLATSLTSGLENNGVMGRRIVAGTPPLHPGGQLSMCLSSESLLLIDKGFRNVRGIVAILDSVLTAVFSPVAGQLGPLIA